MSTPETEAVEPTVLYFIAPENMVDTPHRTAMGPFTSKENVDLAMASNTIPGRYIIYEGAKAIEVHTTFASETKVEKL